MQHPTEHAVPQPEAIAEAEADPRDPLMHAMASAEVAVSQLQTPPLDVVVRERAGAYSVDLFYSRGPESVTEFAEAQGVSLKTVANTFPMGGMFTEATAVIDGTTVRAWTLMPDDAPADQAAPAVEEAQPGEAA